VIIPTRPGWIRLPRRRSSLRSG